jgi:hypothetical protein
MTLHQLQQLIFVVQKPNDVGDAPASCLGGPGFISTPGHQLSRWFLAEIILNPEDGGDIFLRNVI